MKIQNADTFLMSFLDRSLLTNILLKRALSVNLKIGEKYFKCLKEIFRCIHLWSDFPNESLFFSTKQNLNPSD